MKFTLKVYQKVEGEKQPRYLTSIPCGALPALRSKTITELVTEANIAPKVMFPADRNNHPDIRVHSCIGHDGSIRRRLRRCRGTVYQGGAFQLL